MEQQAKMVYRLPVLELLGPVEQQAINVYRLPVLEQELCLNDRYRHHLQDPVVAFSDSDCHLEESAVPYVHRIGVLANYPEAQISLMELFPEV